MKIKLFEQFDDPFGEEKPPIVDPGKFLLSNGYVKIKTNGGIRYDTEYFMKYFDNSKTAVECQILKYKEYISDTWELEITKIEYVFSYHVERYNHYLDPDNKKPVGFNWEIRVYKFLNDQVVKKVEETFKKYIDATE